MLGMGFLRLNKVLAKHQWKQREGDADVPIEERRKREDRSLTLWVIVIAAFFSLPIILNLLEY